MIHDLEEYDVSPGENIQNVFKFSKENGGRCFQFNDKFCVVLPDTKWKPFYEYFMSEGSTHNMEEYLRWHRKKKLEVLNERG